MNSFVCSSALMFIMSPLVGVCGEIRPEAIAKKLVTSIFLPLGLQSDRFVLIITARNKYPLPLDPGKPVAMGDFGPPIIYTEAKWAQEVNLRASKEVILQCWSEFGDTFGRYYSPVERYRSDDCKVLLLTMGSFSETAMTAVDRMRNEGREVGLVRLRLWRPFPFDEVRQAVKDADVLIVLDRALSFGGPGGPVCSEIKAALYSMDKRPKIVSFVGGLGGRDISVDGFEEIVSRGIEISEKGSTEEFEIFGVRG